MIRKEIDLHLESIAGYINDEDKLVTYKWLSKELNIHVNLSKKLLFEYWDENRDKKNAIEATFLLIGNLDDGGMRVEVVKEADLALAKNKFVKLISEHIYSLQKTLPEIELLAISDKGDPQCGAIRCIDSVLRSEHEMDILRWGTTLSNHGPKDAVQSLTTKVRGGLDIEKKPVEQSNDVKERPAKIAAPKPVEKTQKSAFNNLFAKSVEKQNKEKASASKSKTTSSTNNVGNNNSVRKNAWFEVKKKPESSNGSKDKVDVMDISEDLEKGIVEVCKESPEIGNEKTSASQTSGSTKNKTTPSDKGRNNTSVCKNAWFEVKKKPEISNGSKDKVDVTDISEDSEKPITEVRKESPEIKNAVEKETAKESVKPVEKKKAASAAAATTSRGKKRQSSSKDYSMNKKRKRIVVISSDESSDSEVQDNEPDEPEEPRVPEKIRACPSPPMVKCEGGRRKIRKLVDKTFKDDDGYFVTQKEYVYESCSDKEDEKPAEIVKPVPIETAIKNNKKQKQASLLNFFKKS